MIVLFGFGLGLGVGFYNKEYIRNKCKDICKLYQILKETSKDKNTRYLSASWGVAKFGLKRIWIYIEQYLRQTCVKHQNVYHVQFMIGHHLYKIIVKPPRGPRASEIECFDAIGKTKTDDLAPFIRGLQSQIKLTPKLLGESQLTFVNCDGQTQTFLENDLIQLVNHTHLKLN
jgi:hypothetical protein